jgi:hypothetical protein
VQRFADTWLQRVHWVTFVAALWCAQLLQDNAMMMTVSLLQRLVEVLHQQIRYI